VIAARLHRPRRGRRGHDTCAGADIRTRFGQMPHGSAQNFFKRIAFRIKAERFSCPTQLCDRRNALTMF